MNSLINRQLVAPFLFLLFGLLFFAIGSGLTYRQRTLEGRGIEAQGVVVNLDESYDSDGSSYAPVVQFKTSSGQSVQFVTSYYSSPPDYKIGQPVVVVYSPETPEKAVIKGDGQMLHSIFMLVGGGVVAVGCYLFYSSLRDWTAFKEER